ncbi:MAG: ABC transporter ATP-binding protein [Candidatus Omnitrophota bacterium]|jgi:cobalt transport protein ATP-binding subunit|nr:MAG: ABC transporter ATP-binding protein [Candidatus Omnitrophota bacterium]
MPSKAIEIKDLSFKYPDGHQALRGINLDIFEGETLGIIGPNGAGKSTLLLHFNGIIRGKGHMRINGLAMDDLNLREIRKTVGFVFQDPDSQLFMPTVYEDVAFGPLNMGMKKEDVRDTVDSALSKVDMKDALQRVSHHLSYGEKKRISIATVLSMSPKILVLDEPSSNLDPKHRRDLMNMLKNFALTKIIATHDLDLVLEVCSRVALIDKGQIIKVGQVLEILRDEKLLLAHNLELPLLLACAKDPKRFIKE